MLASRSAIGIPPSSVYEEKAQRRLHRFSSGDASDLDFVMIQRLLIRTLQGGGSTKFPAKKGGFPAKIRLRTWREGNLWLNLPKTFPPLNSRPQARKLGIEVTGHAVRSVNIEGALRSRQHVAHEDLQELVATGLSNYQALLAATFRPAEFLDRLDVCGTVEEGKWADLVLLEGDPLQDISNTRRIAAVMSRGRWLDRQLLDGLLQPIG